ncbi:MAG: hypothetical protein LBG13_00010 [Holosporales bacterium]|jgi:hypothetical protein|nr:hypothetical protein [Holosporales bacterium]
MKKVVLVAMGLLACGSGASFGSGGSFGSVIFFRVDKKEDIIEVDNMRREGLVQCCSPVVRAGNDGAFVSILVTAMQTRNDVEFNNDSKAPALKVDTEVFPMKPFLDCFKISEEYYSELCEFCADTLNKWGKDFRGAAYHIVGCINNNNGRVEDNLLLSHWYANDLTDAVTDIYKKASDLRDRSLNKNK